MTVYGAIVSVVTRKVKAFVSEVRAIVNSAKAEEKRLVGEAESEIQYAILQVKRKVKSRENLLKNEAAKLRDELVAKIEKL